MPKGFRDQERSYERDRSKRRIVVLGDSMVWGYGVQQAEAFTALMEKRRPGIEVVNLGVSGYGTDQELLLLRQEGVRYQPDLIMVVVSSNDFVTNVLGLVYLLYHKPAFDLGGDGRPVLTNVPVPEPSVWRRVGATLVRSSYVLNRTAQVVHKFTDGLVSDGRTPKDTVRTPSFPRDPAEKITVALLGEIQNEARKVGAKLVLVLEDGMGRQGQGLESFFISRHIPVLNLDAVFPQEERERFHLPDDAHWNARGHSVLADCLLNYLEAVGLLSPRQESP